LSRRAVAAAFLRDLVAAALVFSAELTAKLDNRFSRSLL
jgi:hypothetical protein